MRAPSLNYPSALKPHRDADGDARDALEKFPDFDSQKGESTSPRKPNGHANGPVPTGDRWLPRRESQARGIAWAATEQPSHMNGHSRQKSLGDTLRTIRTRHGSMSQSAHELADALKAPVSPKLIVRHLASYVEPDWGT